RSSCPPQGTPPARTGRRCPRPTRSGARGDRVRGGTPGTAARGSPGPLPGRPRRRGPPRRLAHPLHELVDEPVGVLHLEEPLAPRLGLDGRDDIYPLLPQPLALVVDVVDVQGDGRTRDVHGGPPGRSLGDRRRAGTPSSRPMMVIRV